MHTRPTSSYSGLTLIIDKPSRFDTESLLSATAGEWIQDECINRPLSSCDIRDLSESHRPLLPGTTHVALLGDKSIRHFTRDNYSADQHGYPISSFLPARCVGGFYPQDCRDFKPLEDTLTDDDDDDDSSSKDSAPTKRSNYAFWTKWHLKKLLRQPITEPPLIPILYPNLSEVNSWLNSLHHTDLYLDIETSRAHRSLLCVGLSSPSLFPKVYVVPVYLTTRKLAYSNFHQFYKALTLALLRNTPVIHNSSFDLLILHAYYRFPLPNTVYDTMLANHRLFPEAEKSLSHCIAQWTCCQRYHKADIIDPFNSSDEQRLWLYNARDVYNLHLIKVAQLLYATPDHRRSIAQANSMVVPYLENSLTGLQLDRYALLEVASKLEVARKQYGRIASTLVGHLFNPASTKQCREFFHDTLNYPVVERNPTGDPALGRKQLYQLALKHDNPLIPVILKYRKAAKDLSMLDSELLPKHLQEPY